MSWLSPSSEKDRLILAVAGIALAVAVFAKSAQLTKAAKTAKVKGDLSPRAIAERKAKRTLIANAMRKAFAQGGRVQQAVYHALDAAERAGHVVGETDLEWAMRVANSYARQ